MGFFTRTLQWTTTVWWSVGLVGCNPGFVRPNTQDSAQLAAKRVDQKQLEMCLKILSDGDFAVVRERDMPDCAATSTRKGDRCMVDIDKLVPTQATIGFEQVELRRLKIRREIKKATLRQYVAERPQPIVFGPNRQMHIIDHHHLGAALMREGVQRTFGFIVEDLSHLQPQEFWGVMDKCKWVYPVNEDGQTIAYEQLPKKLEDLRDNPYRALAGFVRKSNGFAKVPEPFIEFRWAEFFKKELPLSIEEIQSNYESAVQAALELAKSSKAAAANLPGYLAPGTSPTPTSPASITEDPVRAFQCDEAKAAAARR